MKRSHAPVFWLLFGAGGMLSALTATALVFITGLAGPLDWGPHAGALRYARVLALAQSAGGKVAILLVISLFAWHAAHRIFHSLHDVGLRHGPLAKLACYASALTLTLVTATCLICIGG